jgi:hypothetical protein
VSVDGADREFDPRRTSAVLHQLVVSALRQQVVQRVADQISEALRARGFEG